KVGGGIGTEEFGSRIVDKQEAAAGVDKHGAGAKVDELTVALFCTVGRVPGAGSAGSLNLHRLPKGQRLSGGEVMASGGLLQWGENLRWGAACASGAISRAGEVMSQLERSPSP